MNRIVLMLWLVLISMVKGKDLPGLDYLASGFDALKMISNNEDVTSSDRPRFRLFDLRERNGEDYLLEIGNKTQLFQTPSVIQVTNLNMRKRVAVESVSYTYREFFQSYFNSFTFEFGINVGLAGIALKYHKTLETAYGEITNKQTAIGMSTDWWGMFSVQLAPTFILKFDPIFNLSLSKLVANPITDAQQMFYNQIVLTFGTHYTSSIIVGAVAQMFSLITSKYQERYSKTSIQEQVGLTFQYKQAEMSISGSEGSVVSLTIEDFMKNTHMDIEFSPAILTTPSTQHKQWDMWLEQASLTPVVVNRTLSPLINLLIGYPIEIRRHLELTINYYLKNGHVPTIDQLWNAGQRKKRSITSNRNILPGLDVVGCGYDIFSLKSKLCLLDITMNDNSTWTDVFDNFTTYKVPDGYFVTNTKDLLTMHDTVFFESMKEFVSHSYISNRHDSMGFLGFGASTNQLEMQTKYQRFYQYKYRLAWTKQQAIWFTLAAATFPSPKLNQIANLSISQLPTEFNLNTTDYEKFQRFFDAYGTHIVVQSDIGGMLWAEDYFESCLITKMTETWIRREITKRYWFFATIREISESYHQTVEKEYQENSLSRFEIIGGLTSIYPLTGYNWLPTIKDNPSPVTYRLQPIYTLLPRGAQRDALKKATFYFRSAAANASNLYIQRLQSETSPPPLPHLKCTERRRRGKRSIKKNPFLSTVNNARKNLCPIVGYHGMFCPGETTENSSTISLTASNSTQLLSRQRTASILSLPRSIGMAIDMSTGNILLPALKFTEESTTWTDPSDSGQVFLVPNEVTIIPPQIDDNRITVRIFPTENDLVKVWLNNYETNQWYGGEYARRKNISDVYEQFFQNGQATSISQDFRVKYTISMKEADNPKALQLNEYAQAAVKELTNDYDEELYKNFIDAWGTHITVSNKVGGMTEQQVIFKNCMINTTNFTDGITQSRLEKNLKEELLSRRPCIDHFYWLRRKKFLDHRIGGNILLINNTKEWEKTIIFNPAVLLVQKYVPWYQMVTDERIQNNLRRAIENRIKNINIIRQEQARKIQEHRANLSLAAQIVYGYSMRRTISDPSNISNPSNGNGSTIEWEKYSFTAKFTLQGSQQCSAGMESQVQLALLCSAERRKIGACAIRKINNLGVDTIDITKEVPITYERNHTTGSFRVVARRQYGERVANHPDMEYKNSDLQGEWVHVGCSVIHNKCIDYSKSYDTTEDMKNVYLCSGCDVQCLDADKTQCRCFCPTYPVDPQGEPFEPYCR